METKGKNKGIVGEELYLEPGGARSPHQARDSPPGCTVSSYCPNKLHANHISPRPLLLTPNNTKLAITPLKNQTNNSVQWLIWQLIFGSSENIH